MGIAKTLSAQSQFTVDAPQQRVWNLLGRVIYQCLPLEKMDVVNEKVLYAELRWKLAFVALRFHIRVEFVDISPPNLFVCLISVRKGIIQLSLRVIFALRPVNQQKTEVTCTAAEEGKAGMLQRWATRRQQQNFAENIFDSMKARLEQLG